MRRSTSTWVAAALAITGCQRLEHENPSFDPGVVPMVDDEWDTDFGEEDEFPGDTTGAFEPVDSRPVVHSDVIPLPISGGTLAILAGTTAIAADPDRDRVFVTPLAEPDGFVAVVLEPGDEPGRVIVDDDGLAHVALRGAGAIATIDPAAAVVLARHETCANPRGLALDRANDRVLVACAGGELIAHEVGGPIRERMTVAADLRDVIVRDNGTIAVSRFRSAELLTLSDDGQLVDAARPQLTDRAATTAWRTRAMPDGGWLMIHQSSSTVPVDLEPPVDVSPYGGPGGNGCEGPVASILSVANAVGQISSTRPIPFATLPVDAAVSPNGAQMAVAIAGQSDFGSPTIGAFVGVTVFPTAQLPGDPEEPCAVLDFWPFDPNGQVVAVEFADDDTLVWQTREPAGIHVYSILDGSLLTIDLFADSRYDTGHEMFHQDAGAGLACASCHPEGGDDGFVWTFAPGDLRRRTQSLRVALAGTEPFHWDGDMADFSMITNEVHRRRMGGPEQTSERIDAFHEWVLAIPPSNPELGDEELVARGSEVFTTSGCATCHNADTLTGGRPALIGGALLQVPPLDGIALRPPYMHDGRAPDLQAAVLDMLASTQPNLDVPPEDIDAIVAYLRTL